LENQLNKCGEFCGCGTPYFATEIVPGKSLVNEVCPICSKSVKPQTFAEYALEADRYITELILPKVSQSEAKENEYYKPFEKT
jgi:hypothetical protein